MDENTKKLDGAINKLSTLADLFYGITDIGGGAKLSCCGTLGVGEILKSVCEDLCDIDMPEF